MMHDFGLQLTTNASISNGDTELIIAVDRRQKIYAAPCPVEQRLVQLLSARPRMLEDLKSIVDDGADTLISARVHYLIDQLDQIGALTRTVMVDEEIIAVLRPNVGFSPKPVFIDHHRAYRLSRFAFFQSEKNIWLLNCPLGNAQIEIADLQTMGAVSALIKAQSLRQFKSQLNQSTEIAAQIFEILIWSGALYPEDQRGTIEEERSDALKHWEFHDLLFHSRSRMGRHVGAFGGSFRFKNLVPEPPALPSPLERASISLPKPVTKDLCDGDQSFQSVLEARCSERALSAKRMCKTTVGEFLFRSMRLKSRRRKGDLEIAFYPYPGGGARSELTAYLMISTCEDVDPGLYRYEPESHALTRVLAPGPDTQRLLKDACSTLQSDTPPPVLIILTSRFRRVSWKYESMAYSVTLKNVGCVLQTYYLVCAAMGLSGCALGGGDSEVFARCIQSDYYEETSVGEFAFGSRKLERT